MRYLFFLAVFLVSLIVRGQTDVNYAQLIYNPGLINPSWLNMEKSLQGSFHYKKAWSGVDGAPQMGGFNIHNTFGKTSWGVGIDGQFAKAGIRKNNRFGISVDAGIPLPGVSRLAVGVYLGIDMKKYDWGDVEESVKGKYDYNSFVAGVGVTYAYKRLTLGGSGYMTFDKEDENIYRLYFVGSYRIPLCDNWQVKPLIFYNYDSRWDDYVEVGVRGGYKDIVNVGVSSDFDNRITLLGEIGLFSYVSFAYSYDVHMGDLADLSKGAHEFSLKFNLASVFSK